VELDAVNFRFLGQQAGTSNVQNLLLKVLDGFRDLARLVLKAL
jgi:hypothetical protein